jgi:hypothetical protein
MRRPLSTLIFVVAMIAIVIIVVMIFPARAQAQWYSYPYAPWRIQPGFRAPPVADPYAPARALAYGVAPPVDTPPVEYAPSSPSPPPLGWIYGPYTVCADPPRCGAIVISVGADGLNVRMAPNGPVVAALANGVPVIPLQRDGNWMLVAPACALAPTWTWSVTSGVPLSVCL